MRDKNKFKARNFLLFFENVAFKIILRIQIELREPNRHLKIYFHHVCYTGYEVHLTADFQLSLIKRIWAQHDF